MAIKIVLIAAVVLVALVLAGGHGARRLALRRLGLAAFAAVAVVSILLPDTLTWVAQKVDVGRGTDLLLYALIVVFFSYLSTRYVRDRRTLRQVTVLARRVALIEALPPRPAIGLGHGGVENRRSRAPDVGTGAVPRDVRDYRVIGNAQGSPGERDAFSLRHGFPPSPADPEAGGAAEPRLRSRTGRPRLLLQLPRRRD